MQFNITAYDYTDKDSLARRMAVRPAIWKTYSR